MKIVCVSDLHCKAKEISLPKGDVLVCAGDFTYRGTESELALTHLWVKRQSKEFAHVIMVAGNHDFGLSMPRMVDYLLDKSPNAHLLHNEAITVDGVKFWGSPYSPTFGQWAFMREEYELEEFYKGIPDDTQVLITHTPPNGVLDRVGRPGSKRRIDWDISPEIHAGSTALRARVDQLTTQDKHWDSLEDLQPPEKQHLRLHVFGHIHEAGGSLVQNNVIFNNAAMMDVNYNVGFQPYVWDIDFSKPFNKTVVPSRQAELNKVFDAVKEPK
jgi:Icc-related predicted phosphoesterase